VKPKANKIIVRVLMRPENFPLDLADFTPVSL